MLKVIFQQLIGIKFSWGLPTKSFRFDQPFPSNLLKTNFPLKMVFTKCLAKQQWLMTCACPQKVVYDKWQITSGDIPHRIRNALLS